jgi:hypothetical protein
MDEISGLVPIFLGGASGVVVIEAAKFASASMGQKAGQRITIYKRGTYWVGLIALVIIAGFVTTLSVGDGPISLINALQIGINAPALVTAWATASQRDAITKKRLPSLGINPSVANEGSKDGHLSLSRRILDDQAW